jgi:hypothetical protein
MLRLFDVEIASNSASFRIAIMHGSVQRHAAQLTCNPNKAFPDKTIFLRRTNNSDK